MKTLYLIRHAIAEEQCADYPNDAARPLTDEGTERFRLQVKGLRTLDVAPEVILTSPLLRCRQTAQLLADGLEGDIPLVVSEVLRPGAHPADVLEGLGAHRRTGAIALVGHEPSMGHLASTLIGATGPIPFKKGSVCRIDVDAFPPRGAGVLIWMLPPRALRLLGE